MLEFGCYTVLVMVVPIFVCYAEMLLFKICLYTHTHTHTHTHGFVLKIFADSRGHTDATFLKPVLLKLKFRGH
jgi:hypothetical protein